MAMRNHAAGMRSTRVFLHDEHILEVSDWELLLAIGGPSFRISQYPYWKFFWQSVINPHSRLRFNGLVFCCACFSHPHDGWLNCQSVGLEP